MTRINFVSALLTCATVAGCGGGTSNDGTGGADAGENQVMHDGGGSTPFDDAGGAALQDASVDPSVTSVTGTLGALGTIQPIVSSRVISNSGETLVYLTTAPLSCADLAVSRWLGSFATGAQVIEIVVSGSAKIGSASKPEVNYAAGGKSSAYEKNAKTASVTFTRSDPMGVVEGTVSATYDNPAGELSGNFHADFCPNGQDY